MANSAAAHEFIPGVSGFPALMLHPIFLTDQLVGIATVGLVTGRTKPLMVWPLILLFGLGLASGQGLVYAIPELLLYLWPAPYVVILIAAAIIAAFGQISRMLAISLVVPLAMVIGVDIQPEGPAFLGAVQANAATVLTGSILILTIGWLTSRSIPQWAVIVIRVIAAWIAASSLMVLAYLFR